MRIAITGIPGSGKTTLAIGLKNVSGIPLYGEPYDTNPYIHTDPLLCTLYMMRTIANYTYRGIHDSYPPAHPYIYLDEEDRVRALEIIKMEELKIIPYDCVIALTPPYHVVEGRIKKRARKDLLQTELNELGKRYDRYMNWIEIAQTKEPNLIVLDDFKNESTFYNQLMERINASSSILLNKKPQ